MGQLAVTVVGVDQPGIVAAVAEVLHERGANISDSAMTMLGGHFAVLLLVTSEEDPDTLEHALRGVTAHLGLRVVVAPADGSPVDPADATHLLDVHGTDQPGLLWRVTSALADLDVDITDLETRLLREDDPPVYAMVVELVVPDGNGDELADAIALACDDLGVEHTLRAIDAETW